VAVPTHLVLAMAQQQRGQAKEARASLAQAVLLLDRKGTEAGSPAVGTNWPDWLVFQVLRHEAEALIEGKKDAPKQ
jgi:hypothetical protein